MNYHLIVIPEVRIDRQSIREHFCGNVPGID
jgi:hypothetical protein